MATASNTANLPTSSLGTNSKARNRPPNDVTSQMATQLSDNAHGQEAEPIRINQTRSGRTVNAPKVFDSLLKKNTQSSKKRPRIDKPIEETANPEADDDSVPASKQLNNLPDIPLKFILGELETYEQISLRFVCLRWNGIISGIIKSTRYLKLNCAPDIIPGRKEDRLKRYREWSIPLSDRSIQFDENWKEPKLDSYQKAKHTVRDKHFTMSRINIISSLFADVEVLVIYYDVRDTKGNLEVLLKLIRKFTKLTSFSIIRAECCDNFEILKKESPRPSLSQSIINTLGEMDCKLDRVDLFLKVYGTGKNSSYPLEYGFLDKLAPVRHFAIASWPPELIPPRLSPSSKTNYSNDMFLKVGSSVTEQGQENATAKIESLCVQLSVNFDGNLIEKLKLKHVLRRKPELEHVQRLQLTNISSHLQVRQFLAHCHQVKTLGLYSYKEFLEFSNDIVELIGDHEQLTKLVVFYAAHPEEYDDGSSAPNIRQLTFSMPDDVYRFSNIESHKFKTRYVDFIVNKFPELKKLTLVTFCKFFSTEKEKIREKIRNMFLTRLPTLTEVTILHLNVKWTLPYPNDES